MAYVPVSAPSPWGAFSGGAGGGNFVQAMQMMMGLRKEREAREHREEMASLCKGLDMSSAHDLGICADKMRDHGEMDTARWMASQAIQRSQIEQQVAGRALRREENQAIAEHRQWQREQAEAAAAAPADPDEDPRRFALERHMDAVGGPPIPGSEPEIYGRYRLRERLAAGDINPCSAQGWEYATPAQKQSCLQREELMGAAGRAPDDEDVEIPVDGDALETYTQRPELFVGAGDKAMRRAYDVARQGLSEHPDCADAFRPSPEFKDALETARDWSAAVNVDAESDETKQLRGRWDRMKGSFGWIQQSFINDIYGIPRAANPCAPPAAEPVELPGPPEPGDPVNMTPEGREAWLAWRGASRGGSGVPGTPATGLGAPSAPGAFGARGSGMDAALMGAPAPAEAVPTVDLMQPYRDRSISPFLQLLTGRSADPTQRVPGGPLGR